MQLQFVNVGDILQVSGNEWIPCPYHYLDLRDHVEVKQFHPHYFEGQIAYVLVKSLTNAREQWIKIKHLKPIL